MKWGDDMKYNLLNVEGSAFSIISYVAKAMKQEKCSEIDISNYMLKAKAAGYDDMIVLSLDELDKLNCAKE